MDYRCSDVDILFLSMLMVMDEGNSTLYPGQRVSEDHREYLVEQGGYHHEVWAAAKVVAIWAARWRGCTAFLPVRCHPAWADFPEWAAVAECHLTSQGF